MKIFAVVAVYPSGRRVLVGFGKNVEEADALIAECIAYNGEEKLKEMGVHFNVELAG